MTIVSFEPNSQLRILDFARTLDYRISDPWDASCSSIADRDPKTQDRRIVFVKSADLHSLGLSLTILHSPILSSGEKAKYITSASKIDCSLRKAVPIVAKYLSAAYCILFEEKISFINRVIGTNILEKRTHSQGQQEIPGIYFLHKESESEIFINLKKTDYLGEGSYGKIRRVLWLTAPNNPTVAVKKVVKDPTLKEDLACFERELDTLKSFREKRGIISVLGGGIFGRKAVIFLPMYQCSMKDQMELNRMTGVFFDQKQALHLISQVLEGVATISEIGVHGDLSFSNLLLRNDPSGDIEVAIADFGAFQFHGEGDFGRSTPTYAPPEYFASKTLGPKHDVWGAGLFLYELFSVDRLSVLNMGREERIQQWVASLTPGWVLNRLFRANMPKFILELMNQMLHPSQNSRPTPKQCWERFSSGYESFLKENPAEKVK